MSVLTAPLPDVYSARDIARAASARVRDVDALVATGQVRAIERRLLAETEALRAVRLLSGVGDGELRTRPIFYTPAYSPRPSTAPYAVSTAVHAGLVAILVLFTLWGIRGTVAEAKAAPEAVRLVFLAIPGPGGGGGGGGVRRPDPPARAELKGKASLRSPVRTEPRRAKVEPPDPPKKPDVRPVEEPVAAATTPVAPPVPPVTAPVASVAADAQDRPGVPEAPPAAPASEGPGEGGGSGTGRGTGMGEGQGSGIGAGEGGGTGGGPYRPGSGITPPGLLREVKPQYTEEARRLGIEGDVVLEIVVKSDGTVGPVTLLQRLGSGLDQRAIEAVRQWRFSPARRFGTAVDVLVEVAVEFKLR